MDGSLFADAPCGLGPVLERRGFQEFTPVQIAVLDPALVGRDLRIASQTGSGKTVALGLVIAADVMEAASVPGPSGGPARPAVLVVAPTRELAVQLARELSWMARPLGASVGSLTGGTSLEGDMRMLRRNPTIVVGTPGRLLDHVRRKSLVLDEVRIACLDEADEMLAMGFVDDVEALLSETPEGRQTHLMSATFPASVRSLARRHQREPVEISGGDNGKANEDIVYRTITVRPQDRFAALVNLMLVDPEAKSLVFVRTRDAVTGLSTELASRGFSARGLSGELSQRERTATLEAFRAGAISVLVATDVAARGLDVPDIDRVVHFDLPDNAEVLTHRSGRTGRAGRQGTTYVLVPSGARGRAHSMLRQAGIEAEATPPPSPADVARAADDRLTVAMDEALESPLQDGDRQRAVAVRLLEDRDPVEVVAALLTQHGSHRGPCDAMEVAPVPVNAPERRRGPVRSGGRAASGDWTRFQVSWGRHHGADPGRMLAMLCRRGGITSGDIGAIEIRDRSSMVEVSAHRAQDFARAATRPDERDPHVKIREWREAPAPRGARTGPTRRDGGAGRQLAG
jgi:ATP-dependent RNA helicase DeaD